MMNDPANIDPNAPVPDPVDDMRIRRDAHLRGERVRKAENGARPGTGTFTFGESPLSKMS